MAFVYNPDTSRETLRAFLRKVAEECAYQPPEYGIKTAFSLGLLLDLAKDLDELASLRTRVADAAALCKEIESGPDDMANATARVIRGQLEGIHATENTKG